MISNAEFLKVLFGDDHIWAHVCCFPDDPSNIPGERRGVWAGNYFRNYYLQPGTNQYFCISTFMGDEDGRSRRRKANFRYTHVIVADDVNEKLPVSNVMRLPHPTYKLQTSPGSEQWGWVLNVPCQERHRVENLLDGLVAQGLAPDGKDPGMKGVTRYVRLPEGVNTKASKLVEGVPQPCRVIEWNPTIKVSIEDLAKPFGVDLDAERRETRVDGAADIPDHPLLHVPEISIKDVRSEGRFDITCPWVSDHTNEADDGAAVFTNADGSLGFKCHHGSCQHRTGADLLNLVEDGNPGFKQHLSRWQLTRTFERITGSVTGSVEQNQTIDFMGGQFNSLPGIFERPGNLNFMGAMPNINPDQMVSYQDLVNSLRRVPPHSDQATTMAYEILKAVDQLDHGSRLNWWNQVREYMDWNKHDLQAIIEQQRLVWYPRTVRETDFYMDFVYVAEQNQFYNPKKRLWLTPEAFQNAHGHHDNEARTEALLNGRVRKVDRVDYAPGMPYIFNEQGTTYVNGWSGEIEKGVPGCVQRWLDHFDVLGWQADKKHMLQFMAFTLRHPERKINHILILGGGEGNGKDFILYPLSRAMRNDSTTIDGDELLRDFNDFLLGTKYLHINEADLGDRREANAIHNRLKPIAASPPSHLRVNQKGIRPILIRNVVNSTMTTNSAVPIGVKNTTRRYYAVWTELSVRDENGQMSREWQAYWDDRWKWMRDCEGWKACVDYLHTQVDLSDFDPGAVPYVTDYMKSIQEASEDPVATLLREYIQRRLSFMASDIVTNADIFHALKTANVMQLGVELKNTPTVNTIGKIMKQNGLGTANKMFDGEREHRIWIIRNFDPYMKMKGRELFDTYTAQMKKVKQAMDLKLVKPVQKEEGAA